MTLDLVDALGLKKNSTKDQILEEVKNFRKLAAEADIQKKEIENLRNHMYLPNKEDKSSKLHQLQVQESIFSEKPNYTTAKFFGHSSDP